MFSRNKQGERRVSPPVYKFLLTTHIIVSVGWLGATLAKLVLGLVVITTRDASVANALYLAMGAVNIVFPPVAVATVITGVLLSLGTKWGLLQHYWIVTKLVLTVGVISTAIQLGGSLVQMSLAAPAPNGGAILGIASAPTTLLLSLCVVHVLMLGTATVISVYKPWGKTWFGRRPSRRPSAHALQRTIGTARRAGLALFGALDDSPNQ